MIDSVTKQKRVFKLTFWPTAMTAVMVSVALVLGVWQTQRLIWKEALIADREARIAAAPMTIAAPGDLLDVNDLGFRRVQVKGTLQHAQEMAFLSRDAEGRAGYMLITPLQLSGYAQAEAPWVFVNRGWVSMEERDPDQRPRDPFPASQVTITGVIHPGHQKSCINFLVTTQCFTPDNAPDENIWFWTDYAAMSDFVGHKAAPFVVVAERAEDPMQRPKGGQVPLANIPNNHLQYAITWFCMAIIGTAFWFFFHWRPADEGEETS